MQLVVADVEKVLQYRIYSKRGCIYCDAAMELLKSKSIKFEEVKIDNNLEQLEFMKSQGFRTVPQIYNEMGEYVGGYVELKSYLETE